MSRPIRYHMLPVMWVSTAVYKYSQLQAATVSIIPILSNKTSRMKFTDLRKGVRRLTNLKRVDTLVIFLRIMSHDNRVNLSVENKGELRKCMCKGIVIFMNNIAATTLTTIYCVWSMPCSQHEYKL